MVNKVKRVESFVDGELLPIVGGPLDGKYFAVKILFPFLNGGIPNGGFEAGGHFYKRVGREWHHTETVTPKEGNV